MLNPNDLDDGVPVDRRLANVYRWPFARVTWTHWGRLRRVELTVEDRGGFMTAVGTAPGLELVDAVATMQLWAHQRGLPW